MRQTLLAGFALALLFAAGGCADSYDKVTKDSLATMNEIADICDKIKTADDVEKYRKDLERLADRMKDIEKRMEKLGDPDEETQERLMETYDAEFEKAIGRMNALGKKMSDPAIEKKMMEIFRGVEPFFIHHADEAPRSSRKAEQRIEIHDEERKAAEPQPPAAPPESPKKPE